MTSEITLFVNPTAGRGRGARAAQPAASALRAAGFSRHGPSSARTPTTPLARARAAVAGGHRRADRRRRRRHGLPRAPGASPAPAPRSAWSPSAPATTSPAPSGLPVRDPAAAGRLVAEALKGPRPATLDLGRVGRPLVRHRPRLRLRLPGQRPRQPDALARRPLQVRPGDARRAGRLPARPVPDHARRRARSSSSRPPSIAVGNGTSYGGGMRICADAELDDGLFDVTVVGDCSRADPAAGLPAGLQGHPPRPPGGHRAPGRAGRARGRRDVTGYADGEPLGAAAADRRRCVPGAVRCSRP